MEVGPGQADVQSESDINDPALLAHTFTMKADTDQPPLSFCHVCILLYFCTTLRGDYKSKRVKHTGEKLLEYNSVKR